MRARVSQKARNVRKVFARRWQTAWEHDDSSARSPHLTNNYTQFLRYLNSLLGEEFSIRRLMASDSGVGEAEMRTVKGVGRAQHHHLLYRDCLQISIQLQKLLTPKPAVDASSKALMKGKILRWRRHDRILYLSFFLMKPEWNKNHFTQPSMKHFSSEAPKKNIFNYNCSGGFLSLSN